MKFSCILVAAGRGLRALSAAGQPNKVLVQAGGKPILHYSLMRFAALEECKQIVLVVNGNDLKQGFFDKTKLAQEFRVSEVVEGGELRADSVRNGLAAVDPAIELVAVHDAARPFISGATIIEVVAEAEKHGAAIAAIPAGDTLKSVGPDMFVTGTLKREGVWRAQTPQAFRRELLERAFAAEPAAGVTDDAQLVELVGGKVKLVQSQTTNIKITTPGDLEMALRLLPIWGAEGS